MEKQLIEKSPDGVATLTFNWPDRLNALSTPIMEGLLEALPRPARDAAVGVIVPAWWGHKQLKGLLRLAERHARHLAGRAQTLQDARKPMHTDPSTILMVLSENNARTSPPEMMRVMLYEAAQEAPCCRQRLWNGSFPRLVGWPWDCTT